MTEMSKKKWKSYSKTREWYNTKGENYIYNQIQPKCALDVRLLFYCQLKKLKKNRSEFYCGGGRLLKDWKKIPGE